MTDPVAQDKSTEKRRKGEPPKYANQESAKARRPASRMVALRAETLQNSPTKPRKLRWDVEGKKMELAFGLRMEKEIDRVILKLIG